MRYSERYSRQIIAENWDQRKLEESVILIAGAGSLGCLSALNFTVMGVGRIIIVDYDTVEISNLNRQVLFSEEDVGKAKSIVAKNKLEKINPLVKIDAYNTDIRNLDRKIIENTHVLIDGLDSFEARRWLNSTAVSLNKPLILAGLYGWWGNIQVVLPHQTACLECQPLIPRNRLQQYCSPRGRERGGEVKTDSKPNPIITTTCMVVSGIQCQEALKIILGLKEKIIKEYIFYDGLNEKFTYMEVNRNPECVVCGEKHILDEREFAVTATEEVKQVKERLKLLLEIENCKIIFKEKILRDESKIQDLNITENEYVYVISKDLNKPLKLRFKIV
ncbi:MAG: ThiF family adenylyltransferase [Candidatus Odinarchaeum yellowstonii]|jgi:molybdopterin/thiamine biosynthesis adenylyltransferase|uniref:ThiF family adenylyltransferase n=1 Tax=Odinarchaeota yellowstonii (strain LCB_4) TaxID=1841599 RepID=A0AAF0D1H8_ODILC|nr:MAG: ThiF family adenylyltransferase [Candidatus Odinarchaeum yellowstonii]